MNQAEQRKAARPFVERWQQMPCVEEEHSRSFWIELLGDVLGVPNPTHVLEFERKVKGRKIDVFYEDMGVLVEMKSRGVDLDKPSVRSKEAGEETPYQQACWYATNLVYSIRPRWIVTCNFDEFRIYDQDNPDQEGYLSLGLQELPEQLHLLSFLTDKGNSRLEREKDLSVEAARLVGKLYSELSQRYMNLEEDENEQRSLNVLVVRLVFLLYAEDAGVLQKKDAFLDYMRGYEPPHMRQALIDLFDILDTPKAERDPYKRDELLAFPYVNGGLFRDPVVIPQFTEQIRLDLLLEASQGFDWSGISPTIFGAAFESTLNPETRREGGMHYTSIENIHRVIDPLFLDGLKAELANIEGEEVAKKRKVALRAFQDKLASIKVFDPACGSGNFLTESYLCLRKLENRVLEALQTNQGGHMQAGLDYGDAGGSPIKVGIDQFYGIEVNDFAVSVAKTALWIAEEQMMDATQEVLFGGDFDFLPLTSNQNIRLDNALRTDWEDVLPASECAYVVGNPPFVGARYQTKEQKQEVLDVFDGARNAGNIDYCGAWYVLAARYIEGTHARCALVSTNSICQGEQVANLWKPLFDMGVRIDFAHDTFRWDNDATDKAHVFCVIVGFSREGDAKRLFHHATPDSHEVLLEPGNINAYLADAPDVFIYGRSKPICDVPEMGIGNKPIDGGNYLFKREEMEAFLAEEPGAARFFRAWLGSQEFLHNTPRYCLWLGDAAFSDLKGLPKCRERIRAVREFRLASKSKPTNKLADTPQRFHVENMPEGNSIIVPQVSSCRRRYIPMGFIGPEVLCSDKLRMVPNGTLYHFGVLQSQFQNAWMRMVSGRLKNDYQYANSLAYNCFVWPDPTDEQRVEVERCAQAVLDARAAHPDATLADMYDPDNDFLFPDLMSAHRALDAAVEAAYGVDFNGDEEKIVAYLFGLYAEKTEGK